MGSEFSKIVDGVEDFFNFVVFLIENIIDSIFGILTIIYSVAKQAASSIPLILDIIDYLLELINYTIELFENYYKVAVVTALLTPMYFMLFFLIDRINKLI